MNYFLLKVNKNLLPIIYKSVEKLMDSSANMRNIDTTPGVEHRSNGQISIFSSEIMKIWNSFLFSEIIVKEDIWGAIGLIAFFVVIFGIIIAILLLLYINQKRKVKQIEQKGLNLNRLKVVVAKPQPISNNNDT